MKQVRSQEEKRKDRTQHAGVRDKRGRQEIVSVVHCKVRINHNFFLPFLNYCRHCKTHIKIHIITLCQQPYFTSSCSTAYSISAPSYQLFFIDTYIICM